MKNLIIIFLILLSINASAQNTKNYTGRNVVYSTQKNPLQMDIRIKESQVTIKRKKIIIKYDEQKIVVKTKDIIKSESLDFVEYFCEMYIYKVKNRNIKDVNIVPNDDGTVGAVALAFKDGNNIQFNFLE